MLLSCIVYNPFSGFGRLKGTELSWLADFVVFKMSSIFLHLGYPSIRSQKTVLILASVPCCRIYCLLESLLRFPILRKVCNFLLSRCLLHRCFSELFNVCFSYSEQLCLRKPLFELLMSRWVSYVESVLVVHYLIYVKLFVSIFYQIKDWRSWLVKEKVIKVWWPADLLSTEV